MSEPRRRVFKLCPTCKSSNIAKKGRRRGKQKYCCKDCGLWFQNSYKKYRNSNGGCNSLISKLVFFKI